MVSIVAFQAVDPSSILGNRIDFLIFFYTDTSAYGYINKDYNERFQNHGYVLQPWGFF